MSGDIFWLSHLEARDAAKHSMMLRIAPITVNDRAQHCQGWEALVHTGRRGQRERENGQASLQRRKRHAFSHHPVSADQICWTGPTLFPFKYKKKKKWCQTFNKEGLNFVTCLLGNKKPYPKRRWSKIFPNRIPVDTDCSLLLFSLDVNFTCLFMRNSDSIYCCKMLAWN